MVDEIFLRNVERDDEKDTEHLDEREIPPGLGFVLHIELFPGAEMSADGKTHQQGGNDNGVGDGSGAEDVDKFPQKGKFQKK